MPTITGGLRDRYALDSVWYVIWSNLETIGYMATDNVGVKQLQYRRDGFANDTKLEPNMIAIEVDHMPAAREAELGSQFAEHRRTYYVDLLAESKTVGLQICGDIKSILEGRRPELNRTRPSIALYEWANEAEMTEGTDIMFLGTDEMTLGAASQLGWMRVDGVRYDQYIEDPSVSHRRNMWTIRIDTVEYFGTSDDLDFVL